MFGDDFYAKQALRYALRLLNDPVIFDLASPLDEQANLATALLQGSRATTANYTNGHDDHGRTARAGLTRACAILASVNLQAVAYARFQRRAAATWPAFCDHVLSRPPARASPHPSSPHVRNSSGCFIPHVQCKIKPRPHSSTSREFPFSHTAQLDLAFGGALVTSQIQHQRTIHLMAFAAYCDLGPAATAAAAPPAAAFRVAVQRAASVATFVFALLLPSESELLRQLPRVVFPHNVIVALALNDWPQLSAFFGLDLANAPFDPRAPAIAALAHGSRPRRAAPARTGTPPSRHAADVADYAIDDTADGDTSREDSAMSAVRDLSDADTASEDDAEDALARAQASVRIVLLQLTGDKARPHAPPKALGLAAPPDNDHPDLSDPEPRHALPAGRARVHSDDARACVPLSQL